MKHSRATIIELFLDTEDEKFNLRVMDNGVGFDPEAYEDDDEHFGLRGMRERAKRVDADLRIQSSPGAPSIIRLHLPLPELKLPNESES